jgi:hypothetical protein
MIDSNPNSFPLTSYAEAIRLVSRGLKPAVAMPGGTTTRLDQTKLLQNYEAILHCAGIEQMLGEAIGRGPCFLLLEDADRSLSQFAEVHPSWLPSMGQLLKGAAAEKAVEATLLKEIEEIKVHRDNVLHGQQPSFGASLRKRVKRAFEKLRSHKLYTPRAELLSRLEEVAKAKTGKVPADEILRTLETLYLSIEAESDVRTALPKPRGQAIPLPAVASIFELKRLDPILTKIFKRDQLAWHLRASALIRNHLVHGTLVTPTARQAGIIRAAHENLGRALSELQCRKNGVHTVGGELRNGLDL